MIVVGNVGFLMANIPLIPDALPDDGLFDVLVASPRTFRDWVRLTTRVLTRAEAPTTSSTGSPAAGSDHGRGA